MITSKRFGYGVCVLYELATREGGHHSARDIAQGYSVPEAFVRRILLDLRRANLVAAQKGRTGGYRLAHSPTAIKLGQLVKALEPETPTLVYGRQRRGTSMSTEDCPVAPFWKGIEEQFSQLLAETTLADVIARTQATGGGPSAKRQAGARKRRKARK